MDCVLADPFPFGGNLTSAAGRIEKRSACYSGLFLAGNAYHGVALNDCTEQAQIVAGQVKEYLRSLDN